MPLRYKKLSKKIEKIIINHNTYKYIIKNL